jgi:hypothetical protein
LHSIIADLVEGGSRVEQNAAFRDSRKRAALAVIPSEKVDIKNLQRFDDFWRWLRIVSEDFEAYETS